MVRSGRPAGVDGQQSLGELVALAAKDMSSLIRYEISLAKKEFTLDAKRIGFAAGIGVVALFVLCLIVVLLCFAYAYGLVAAFGIPIWLSFICVAGTCVVLIALAAAFAYWLDPQGDRHEDDAEDRDGRHRHAAQGRRQPERLRGGRQEPGSQRGYGR